MPKIINSFRGKYYFLSNFYLVDIYYEDINYISIEHAYQAAKTLNRNDRLIISHLKTAGMAKNYGRTSIKLRPDWEDIKFSVMKVLIQTKFQFLNLANALLATADSVLIEGNDWHDSVFGECYCGKCGPGQNMLGKLLMQVRDELK